MRGPVSLLFLPLPSRVFRATQTFLYLLLSTPTPKTTQKQEFFKRGGKPAPRNDIPPPGVAPAPGRPLTGPPPYATSRPAPYAGQGAPAPHPGAAPAYRPAGGAAAPPPYAQRPPQQGPYGAAPQGHGPRPGVEHIERQVRALFGFLFSFLMIRRL